jgi:hypothetical protein
MVDNNHPYIARYLLQPIARASDYLLSWAGLRVLALCGVAVLILAASAQSWTRRLSLRPTRQPSAVEGLFTRKGQHQGEPLASLPDLRLWGSWCGSDVNQGTLTIGPFSTPARLDFYASGYPGQPGITIKAINQLTGESMALPVADIGESWQLQQVTMPASWDGQPMKLVAIDASVLWRGWVGISEPVVYGVIPFIFLRSLVAFVGLGIAYLALVVVGMHEIARRDWLPAHWQALGGFALAALISYAIFWLYFLHPWAGHIGAGLAIVTTALLAWRVAGKMTLVSEAAPLVVTVLLAFLYVGITHLVASPEEIDALARSRFRFQLPWDNSLPAEFAGMLFRGEPAKHIGTDWLTSDRPPLQTGWTLLTYGAAKLFAISTAAAGGCAGLWLQISWVAGVYGLLREFRLSSQRASAWTVLLGFTGFFLLNTVFAWPKLSAAAFGLGVFGLLFGEARIKIPVSYFIFGGLFAALAWLSHGGIAFSFLPLGGVVLWRLFRQRQWRRWGWAATACLILVLPWLAFQKFYAPPANRLFKWHLGGQIAIDSRGTLETIRSAYAKLPAKDIFAAKKWNFELQFVGHFNDLLDFSRRTLSERRHEEFFYPFRALGWWMVGLPLAMFGCWLGGDFPRRRFFGLAAWTLATYVVWCLLMFDGAVIHQGSYAAMIGLFILCGLGFARFHRFTFPVFALLIGVYSACTWWGPPEQLRDFGNPAAAGIVALTLVPLLLVALGSMRGPDFIPTAAEAAGE